MTAPSYMMKPKDQAVLKALPGNDKCIDCGLPAPTWASVTLACFMCLECSGRHRGLGTHISFVRSVQMDSWSDAQIAAMKAGGGNDAVKEFLATKSDNSIDMSVLGSTTIRQKYDSPAAELWRQVVKARVNGEEEPTELPELTTSDDESDSDKKYNSIQGGGSSSSNNKRGKNNKKSKVKMEGFGSSPHPSQAKRDRKDKRKKRNKKILGVGAAAIGAIAAVGWARSKRNGGKLSNRV